MSKEDNKNERLCRVNKMNVHYSSNSVEWETPKDFFDKLNSEFRFTLDVCANAQNAKCKHFYSIEEDGLKKSWKGSCWMNPPYGRKISAWIKKAYESSLSGALVVCLIPARTDTSYWHNYVMKGEVRFIRGRLRFGGCKNSAPFPSAVIIFRPKMADNA